MTYTSPFAQKRKPPHSSLFSKENAQLLQMVISDILPPIAHLTQNPLPITFIENTLANPSEPSPFTLMPQDKNIWETGLRTLNHYAYEIYQKPYLKLPPQERAFLLEKAFNNDLKPLKNPIKSLLTPQEMHLWSGDLRAEIMSLFLTHPEAEEALKKATTDHKIFSQN